MEVRSKVKIQITIKLDGDEADRLQNLLAHYPGKLLDEIDARNPELGGHHKFANDLYDALDSPVEEKE